VAGGLLALVVAVGVLAMPPDGEPGDGPPHIPGAPEEPGGPGEPPAGPPAPGQPPSPPEEPEPPDRATPAQCPDGSQPLDDPEVQGLLLAAAGALDSDYTVAVVDRAGRILGLFRKNPPDAGSDDRAVGLARTGAFFSNHQAPLSSRTVRFVSGVHFPPGVARTPNAALYGIENTNRGCDLAVAWKPGKFVPRARSVAGELFNLPCEPGNALGCGTGPVTGKPDLFDTHGGGASPVHDPKRVPVNPGGLPVFRGAFLVGGIGVAGPGLPGNHAEFAALSGIAGSGAGLAFAPSPLPPPGVVFIDGIRLPLVVQTRQPGGTGGEVPAGSFEVGPADGGCAAEGDLVGPTGSATLSQPEVERIVQQAIAAAARTRAVIRLPLGSRARMVIAVGDAAGNILALHRMPDATVFSIDVAVAKARNVVHFSTAGMPDVPPGTAVTNRTIGFGAQPLFPAGIDGSQPGPFFGLFQQDAANPCSQGDQPGNPNQNGIVFFAGSMPLYRDGPGGPVLVGGLGISGDGVEQDDYVAFLGAQGFLPPEGMWADRVRVRGVRLPFIKFPRNPEG
jgi:uncharacterized protein GlcG (DUF336 family)